VAHGWPDQNWTLSRIKTLIGRRSAPSTPATMTTSRIKVSTCQYF
jgi:hypothetical protein